MAISYLYQAHSSRYRGAGGFWAFSIVVVVPVVLYILSPMIYDFWRQNRNGTAVVAPERHGERRIPRESRVSLAVAIGSAIIACAATLLAVKI